MYFNCSLLFYFMSLYALYSHLFGHKLLPVDWTYYNSNVAAESIWLIVVNDWSNRKNI
jgi:hypothetical protein